MADQTIVCSNCRTYFVFSEEEQTFYAAKGLIPPQRCPECRKARAKQGPQSQGEGLKSTDSATRPYE